MKLAGTLITPTLTAAPSSPVVGQMYYNTTTNSLQYWNGTAWVSAIVGAVTSVFTRTGAVVAVAGDYTAAQVTNAADKSSASVQVFTGNVDAVALLLGGQTAWSKPLAGYQRSGDVATQLMRASAGQAVGIGLVADTTEHLRIDTSGKLDWGPGNAAIDTSLYRSASGTLKTDGVLYAVSTIQSDADIYARVGAQRAKIGYNGTVAASGLYTGPSAGTEDTYWYRNGVNTWVCWNGSYGPLQASAFQVNSDRQFKSAIREFGEHKELAEALLGANLYTFKYRRAGDERHLGLMADELPEHITATANHPEGGKHEGEIVQMIDVYKLATALVATVQHLNERLTALEGEAA